MVSGQSKGAMAMLCRGAFGCLEIPYALAMQWRNRRYDRKKAEIVRLGVPVVSVGNITLGGTGKTPLVQWIAQLYQRREVRVAIVSRGYRSAAEQQNDEALQLEQILPEVPHIQNPDRVAGSQKAVEKFDSQLIVLDDGFQHRRLARDLDIVLLDALEPFGYGRVFPRGTLREPLSGLSRADVLILSRADLIESSQREAIRGQAMNFAAQAAWAEVIHAPRELIASDGQQADLNSLKGQRIAAFCGLGNPAGFKRTAESCGYHLLDFREYADHYHYTSADLADLTAWAERLEANAVICTHKDLVKIGLNHLGRHPLWAIRVEIDFK
ncbi:MAG: tetraacyldisaccharide 4'-kinase, partial [Thermoguttaceae bacterium]